MSAKLLGNGDRSGQRQRYAVIGVSLLLALFLCFAVLADAMANIMSRSAPSNALSWRPSHVRALEFQATLDADQAPADSAMFARRALARDLSWAGPVRILGLSSIRQNDQKTAAALFGTAEKLSRRDLLTQLYFIEAAVGRNNVASALKHFDIVMRTSLPGREMLNPVLCEAMRDDGLIMPIAQLLQTTPEWTGAFIGYCVDQSNARPALARALTVAPMARRVTSPVALAKTVQLVAEAGDIGTAHRLYQALLKDAGRRENGLVADPDFQVAKPLPPFDWNYVVNGELRANIDDAGLEVHANGTSGVVASQLLLGRPGQYTLSVQLRSISGGSVTISMACAKGAQSLAAVKLQLAKSLQKLSVNVAIPAGCATQWLRISAETDGSKELNAQIGRVELAPA